MSIRICGFPSENFSLWQINDQCMIAHPRTLHPPSNSNNFDVAGNFDVIVDNWKITKSDPIELKAVKVLPHLHPTLEEFTTHLEKNISLDKIGTWSSRVSLCLTRLKVNTSSAFTEEEKKIVAIQIEADENLLKLINKALKPTYETKKMVETMSQMNLTINSLQGEIRELTQKMEVLATTNNNNQNIPKVQRLEIFSKNGASVKCDYTFKITENGSNYSVPRRDEIFTDSDSE
jgi:hypothetical protein